jgi:hypothetical protein
VAKTMSDAPKEQEPETFPAPPVMEPEQEEDENEEEAEAEDTESLYQKIIQALATEHQDDETPEEFKIRVVTEFSDMSLWPDDKYEELLPEVQDWVYEATTIHKGNINKKRKKPLPTLPGLDTTPEKGTRGRTRATLVDEPKRGRTRATGEDCLTRTMKLLVAQDNPENVKASELVKTLQAKYNREYSPAAVRYAQQAFLTARDLIDQKTAAE